MLGKDAHAEAGQTTALAAALPTGFQDQAVLSGLVHPSVIQFSPDGRIFVAEKRGTIKVFDSLTDTTPVTFADLQGKVDDYWDRGLLGMALAPNFPTNPWVYVLYTYDAAIGAGAPRWSDGCPTPPGPDDRRVRRQRPAVAVPGERRREHRARAGPDQRLVPAVPEPLDRHRGVRARRRPVRERRRRRELQLRRLWPGRRHARRHPDPGEPVQRPRQRGWRTPQPGHSDDADRRRARGGTTAADEIGAHAGTYVGCANARRRTGIPGAGGNTAIDPRRVRFRVRHHVLDRCSRSSGVGRGVDQAQRVGLHD